MFKVTLSKIDLIKRGQIAGSLTDYSVMCKNKALYTQCVLESSNGSGYTVVCPGLVSRSTYISIKRAARHFQRLPRRLIWNLFGVLFLARVCDLLIRVGLEAFEGHYRRNYPSD